MARYGYGKIGRSMPLSLVNCGSLGGDVEMIPVLQTLAERHPEDEFVLIGRNTGEKPTDVGLPPNVVNPWIDWGPPLLERRRALGLNKPNLSVEEQLTTQRLFDELTLDYCAGLDGFILWVGQHGTTNMPLPGIRNPGVLTKPQDWCAYYVSHIIRAVNRWRDVDPVAREEVWLNADPRNDHKLRDLRWPLRHPVLAQYSFTKRLKHYHPADGTTPERAGFADVEVLDDVTWRAPCRSTYARLEVNALTPGSPFGDLVRFRYSWEDREPFGIFINETRRYVNETLMRSAVVREWVLPLEPSWIHGTWSPTGIAELGWGPITALPPTHYFTKFTTARCTFTTPASGTGWATAKPWEAFASGVVCFFHPRYDDQDNILGDAPEGLRDWLRTPTPEDLRRRVRHLSTRAGVDDWEWLVRAQRSHFERAVAEARHVRAIEERIWGS